MVVDVLEQLKALRENIVEALKQDPRYLTLAALDRSIAEISGVLTASGLLAANAAATPAPLSFTTAPAPESPVTPAATTIAQAPGAAAPVAPVAPVVAQPTLAAVAPVISAPVPLTTRVATPPAPAQAPLTPTPTPAAAAVPQAAALQAAAPAAPAKKKPSILKPLAVGAASLAVGGLAAGLLIGSSTTSNQAASSKDDGTGPEIDEENDSEADHAVPRRLSAARSQATPRPEEDDAPASPRPEDEFGQEIPENSVIPAGKSSGYKAMAARAGAAQYQPSFTMKMAQLPQAVDLRPAMTQVENQGNTNSCVANAVAGAYEYWIKKATSRDVNISRLFVYYNARWRDGSQDKDEGSVIQLAMESLAKFGACHEEVWPFDNRLIFKKPGSEAYKLAYENRVHDMAQVPLELDAWKQALAEGKPIVFGLALFGSFDEASKRGGVVPMPSPDDLGRESHGGHAMCAVGYSDAERVFIVRNSWGDDWGDKGYCYVPYSYLINPTFNFGDSWVFVPRVAAPPPRDLWSNVATIVTNGGRGVDFPIETFTVADYTRVAVDLWSAFVSPFNATVQPDYREYVTFAAANLWSRFESFDVSTYLTSTSVSESYESDEESEVVEESESHEESEEAEETEETEESDDAEAVDETEESDETDDSDENDDADDLEASEESEESDEADVSEESEESEESEGSDEAEVSEDSEESEETDISEESEESDEADVSEETEESDVSEESEETEVSDVEDSSGDNGDAGDTGDEGGGVSEEEES